ncbi:LapA family protein [Nitrosomonas sp.]|uniref:LapA family protein n=1 Tax=Nitrosomonas sp. TaxID=42353 RepID=UPI001D5C0965|nr:LapA family protein [Nitrosomonas sp.]MBX3617664.1 LapA family protein [Nitrosomonas sp.]
MMKLITWLSRIFVFVVLAIFASNNSQPIMLQYYFDKSIELPLSVALLIFFALGSIIAAIVVRCRCHSD